MRPSAPDPRAGGTPGGPASTPASAPASRRRQLQTGRRHGPRVPPPPFCRPAPGGSDGAFHVHVAFEGSVRPMALASGPDGPFPTHLGQLGRGAWVKNKMLMGSDGNADKGEKINKITVRRLAAPT